MNPVLEGWRGLAALLVMFAHFGPSLGVSGPVGVAAFTGVDLFFVLSGYVFAKSLFEPIPSLRAYATRRVFRILPAYWFAVMLYAFLSWSKTQDPGPWLSHLFFLHLSDAKTAYALNPAFWSLVPEVEFYLLLPVLSLLVQGCLARFIGLILLSLLMRQVLAFLADRETANLAFVLLHHIPGMLIEFLLGAAVWRLQRTHQWAHHSMLAMLGLGAWLAVAFAFHAIGEPKMESAFGVGQVSLLAALCFAFALAGSNSRSVESAQLRGLLFSAGSLSYGVYLFHNASLAITLNPYAAFVITIVFSLFVFLIIERPARNFGRKLALQLNS